MFLALFHGPLCILGSRMADFPPKFKSCSQVNELSLHQTTALAIVILYTLCSGRACAEQLTSGGLSSVNIRQLIFYHIFATTELYGDSVQKLWGGWIDGVTNILKECEGNLCQELLPNITCPTLIIHGEKDPLVPSFHPQYIHKNVKDSVLHLMPEGRHNLHLRFAEEFNKYVTDFCKE